MAKAIELEILNPRGEVEVELSNPAPRLDSLEGKTVALIDNRKTGAREFLDLIGGFLQADVPGLKLVSLSKMFNEDERIEKYREQLQGVDAAVYATGD